MHQQFPRRGPKTATLPQSAQPAAYPKVTPKIIGRRAQASRLPCRHPLGGHHHAPADVIHRLAASPLVEVGDR
jgi:hypothetical protein